MQLKAASFQKHFHERWSHLNDAHVRALAWLLDSPDLLDPFSPHWEGKIATLGPLDQEVQNWLIKLDAEPEALHAHLQSHTHTRLGHYAEKLLTFYFIYQGKLLFSNLQIRTEKKHTIGEFDFLLRQEDHIVHWEFASKFYLLECANRAADVDNFVGPNLADSLGAKIHKILNQQLLLSKHPSVQNFVSQPITQAKALIKGWLFYPKFMSFRGDLLGLSPHHCKGFWCSFSELEITEDVYYIVLSKLNWLAPLKTSLQRCLNGEEIQKKMEAYFATDTRPVLIALMVKNGEHAVEVDRGFIVPEDWKAAARKSFQQRIIPEHL